MTNKYHKVAEIALRLLELQQPRLAQKIIKAAIQNEEDEDEEEYLGEKVDPKRTQGNNFWVAPNGDLYLSNYYEHDKVMRDLISRGIAKRNSYGDPIGWIRVSSPDWYSVELRRNDKYDPITQRQLDTLFDVARFLPRNLRGAPQNAWSKKLMHEIHELAQYML